MGSNKPIRYVAMGDFQGEWHVLDVVLPFLRDFKPDVVVIGGDFLDFDAISEYANHKRRTRGLDQVLRETREEIDAGRRMLEAIRRAVGNKAKMVFIVGNHEDRLERFFLEYPQMFKEFTTLNGALELDRLGIDEIELGGHYKLGRLYFMHGERYGSDFFTKRAAEKCRKNVRLFHHHTNQSYMITSELDGDEKIEVKSCGCMCGMSPSYLKGQQNRWINSFFCGYVLPNGNYQDFTVSIIDGQMVSPDGKVYGRHQKGFKGNGGKY